jgi:hypothetical protein
MPSDEALKAARAYGLSIDSLTKVGYVEKVGGGVRIVAVQRGTHRYGPNGS